MALPNPLYALVIDVKHRPTKTQGRFFWQMTLRTLQGEIKAMMWDAPAQGCEGNLAFPQLADIISVHDFKDELAQYGSVKVSMGGFVRTTLEELPDDVKKIAEPPKASEEDVLWAKKILFDSSMWKEPQHLEFAKRCFSDFDKETLIKSPAATHVHHSYQHGWLVHTAEVLELCQVIAACSSRKYNFIDTDVLYMAAILHDIGKLYTYKINDIGFAESMVNEKIIGHIFYGMELVQKIGKEVEVSQCFIDEVCHAIACHHGTREWGSFKDVQSIEGGILSRADYISSRNGMMENKLIEYINNQQTVEESFKIYGDSYFATRGMNSYVEANKV